MWTFKNPYQNEFSASDLAPDSPGDILITDIVPTHHFSSREITRNACFLAKFFVPKTAWWFQTLFFIFPYIRNNHPN